MVTTRSQTRADEAAAPVLDSQLSSLSLETSSDESSSSDSEPGEVTKPKQLPVYKIWHPPGEIRRTDRGGRYPSHLLGPDVLAPPVPCRRYRRRGGFIGPYRLPYLPPEIIEQIITASIPSLPSYTFDNTSSQQRVAALRIFSLVSSTWKELAQRELFRWPVLRGRVRIGEFLLVLRREPMRGGMVEGLRVYGGDKAVASEPPRVDDYRYGRYHRYGPNSIQRDDPIADETAGYIVAIIALCTDLKQLWLRRVRGFELGWLTRANKLEHLLLHRVDCNIHTTSQPSVNNPNIRLPALRSLSLNRVRHLGWLSEALTVKIFPRLSSFSYQNSSFDWIDLRSPSILAFFSGLDVLGLDLHQLPTYPFRLPSVLPVLWSHELKSEEYRPLHRFVRLPHWTDPVITCQLALHHLRFIPTTRASHGLPDYDFMTNLEGDLSGLASRLRADQAGLQMLEAIYFPLEVESMLAMRDNGLRDECARRGIDIVFEEAALVEEDSVMSFECWKRGKEAKRRVAAEEAASAAAAAAAAAAE